MADGIQTVRAYQFGAFIVETRFDIDFDTAFATGPARSHGVAMK